MGKKICDHQLFQCKQCNSKGCKENNFTNHLILDSCNPYNSNFEHGVEKCLNCNAEGSLNCLEVAMDSPIILKIIEAFICRFGNGYFKTF